MAAIFAVLILVLVVLDGSDADILDGAANPPTHRSGREEPQCAVSFFNRRFSVPVLGRATSADFCVSIERRRNVEQRTGFSPSSSGPSRRSSGSRVLEHCRRQAFRPASIDSFSWRSLCRPCTTVCFRSSGSLGPASPRWRRKVGRQCLDTERSYSGGLVWQSLWYSLDSTRRGSFGIQTTSRLNTSWTTHLKDSRPDTR